METHRHYVILALGSNLGNRAATLAAALQMLGDEVSDLRASRIYEAPALLVEGSPEEWNLPYYNMAVSGTTMLSPEALLRLAKDVEGILGRKDRGRWGPREIDVDILAYGDLVMRTEHLTIPHPEMLKRNFVMLPLAEIAPDWRYPAEGPLKGLNPAEIIARQGFSPGKDIALAEA